MLRVLSVCVILRRSEANRRSSSLKHAVPDNGTLVSR
jgi:hypothetical protein